MAEVRTIDRPRFLYRYYGNTEFMVDVLSKRRLYHSAPHEFDDPFDCRPLLSLQHSRCNDDRVWKKLLHYFALMVCDMEGRPESDAQGIADEAFERGQHRDKTWLEMTDQQLRTLNATIRVCCFSRNARNVMMWANYAHKHTGVVFQFRTSHLGDATSHEYRGKAVSYITRSLGVEDYVRSLELGFDEGQPQEMGYLMYATKGYEWRGEEEVRFFTDASRQYLHFPEDALTGIVLGDKTPEDLVVKLKDAISGWSKKPRLYKASIAESIHKLCIHNYF